MSLVVVWFGKLVTVERDVSVEVVEFPTGKVIVCPSLVVVVRPLVSVVVAFPESVVVVVVSVKLSMSSLSAPPEELAHTFLAFCTSVSGPTPGEVVIRGETACEDKNSVDILGWGLTTGGTVIAYCILPVASLASLLFFSLAPEFPVPPLTIVLFRIVAIL